MASSSAEIQESSTQLKKETSSPQEATEPPLQPPRRRLPRKPRRPASRPTLKRVVSPLPTTPPETLTPSVGRAFVSVSRTWRIGNVVPYLSGDPLLNKMFQRRMHIQTRDPNRQVNVNQVAQEVENLGSPVDYWVTFPQRLPNGAAIESIQPPPYAWVIGPVNSSRDTLEWPEGTGPQPAVVGSFPWVTNTSGTDMKTLKSILPLNICKIIDFVECDDCKSIMGVAYHIPRRFDAVKNFLSGKNKEILDDGVEILKKLEFPCGCNGDMNQGRPIIQENWRAINWLFLFLGCGLGYCSYDQLAFFCIERELATEGTMNQLLLRVVLDIRKQLDPESSSDDL